MTGGWPTIGHYRRVLGLTDEIIRERALNLVAAEMVQLVVEREVKAALIAAEVSLAAGRRPDAVAASLVARLGSSA